MEEGKQSFIVEPAPLPMGSNQDACEEAIEELSTLVSLIPRDDNSFLPSPKHYKKAVRLFFESRNPPTTCEFLDVFSVACSCDEDVNLQMLEALYSFGLARMDTGYGILGVDMDHVNRALQNRYDCQVLEFLLEEYVLFTSVCKLVYYEGPGVETSVLHLAATSPGYDWDNLKVVLRYLEDTSSVDQLDSRGLTALFLAMTSEGAHEEHCGDCSEEYTEDGNDVSLLLKKGADPKKIDWSRLPSNGCVHCRKLVQSALDDKEKYELLSQQRDRIQSGGKCDAEFKKLKTGSGSLLGVVRFLVKDVPYELFVGLREYLVY